MIIFMQREWLRRAVNITIVAINSRNIPQPTTLSVNQFKDRHKI